MKKTIATLMIVVLMLGVLWQGKAVNASDEVSWSYRGANSFSDLSDGNFNDIIWDDEKKHLALYGRTLYDDFESYGSFNALLNSEWTEWGILDVSSNDGYISNYQGSRQVQLSKKTGNAPNAAIRREISPTRSGEVEFKMTPRSGDSRVVIRHRPDVPAVDDPRRSSQLMVRFQNNNGVRQIRIGSNVGLGYIIAPETFSYEKAYTVKFVWDLDVQPGIDIYLNGRRIERNFYAGLITKEHYFYRVEFHAGSGNASAGTTGRGYLDWIRVNQSVNTSGRYTSQPIPVNVPSGYRLHGDAIASFNRSQPSGTTVVVQTRISRDGGKSWTSWREVSNGGKIPNLNDGDKLDNVQLQYRVRMTTSKSTSTPTLKDIRFNLKAHNKLLLGADVEHTPAWEEKRIEAGRDKREFLAGEPFVFVAETSSHANKVEVVSPFDVGPERIRLTKTGGEWRGTLYDKNFTKLRSGSYTFVVEVSNSSGRVESVNLPVQVKGRINAKVHRTY